MVIVSTSCFDKVILAEIVISRSQFITKNHILTDLIFIVFIFCFMVSFRDNP